MTRACLAALCVLASAVIGGGVVSHVSAQTQTLSFDGRVEPLRKAQLASQLNGMVTAILFIGGERVEAGQPLIQLDDADAKLDVLTAEASIMRAEAELALAQQEAERAQTLRQRDVSTQARVQSAEAALRRAEAELALANVDLERAQLALRRAVIRAPIDGFMGPPAIANGAFVEAEAGPPLGEIVALDPVVVAYRVPYATRLSTLTETGAPNLEALFERLEVAIELPGGALYPATAQPDHATATVDPTDGAVTVRAILPNPDAILRPGMSVTVRVQTLAPEDVR